MGQISMFDGSEPLKIKNKIRLIDLFGWIGAQSGNSIVVDLPMDIFGRML